MPLANRKSALAAASLAALSLTAMPVQAASLPQGSGPAQVGAYDGSADIADGWRRRHRHGHRGGIDAGDVIAGVLVLGGIAAIASAASSNRRERREPVRYPERRDRTRYESSGIDRAVDMCVDQVERGRERVDSVDRAERTRDGWRVGGELATGEIYDCWIDNDGRIRSIDFGSQYRDFSDYSGEPEARRASADEQYSDDVYARARARQAPLSAAEYEYDYERGTPGAEPEGAVDGDLDLDGPRPAYPGGPLPGEEGYEEAVRNTTIASAN